jgi:hypothetical protein
VLNRVVANRILYAVDTHHLLPNTYCGGRKAYSCEYALHMITEKIYAIWKNTKDTVATMLILNITGAFNYVNHPQLIHNLRKRRIPPKIVG